MNWAELSDCTIGPVLKGLVDSGLLTREVARFENKLKMFYKPTGLGLRLFEVLNDVVMLKGRGPPEPRAGVAGHPGDPARLDSSYILTLSPGTRVKWRPRVTISPSPASVIAAITSSNSPAPMPRGRLRGRVRGC